MKSDKNTTAELTFLFKLLPVLHEIDSIDRVQRFLLAMVTACRSVGYRRAVILTLDETDVILQGRYGVERASKRPSAKRRVSFEEMARDVFVVFENVEQTELTLQARTFSVPLDRLQSALVKAVRTSYPVLAERNLADSADDDLFDLIGADSYVAVPLRIGDRVRAVLAVERGEAERQGEAEDISLLYSLAQQASEALSGLSADSEHKRRHRILWKLQDELAKATKPSDIEAAMQVGLLMIGRAVDAAGCLVKDYTHQKTLHVKASQEYSQKSADIDVQISECFDDILDRSAGRMKTIEGASNDPMLTAAVAQHLDSFYVSPLISGDEVGGALCVYLEGKRGRVLTGDQKRFVDMCGAVIAAKLDVTQRNARFTRIESCLEEVTANLARERENSRIGEHSVDYHETMDGYIGKIQALLSSHAPYAKRVPKIAELVRAMGLHSESFERTVLTPRTKYRMADIFSLLEGVVDVWREGTDLTGIDVKLQLPEERPKMLVDKKRIALALANILATTGSYLRAGNELLVECSVKRGRVHICFADTGHGLPGDTISRLFMPFERHDEIDETKRALSLAGEVIEKHSGEVMIKSSGNWKTILIVSFPLAANRDRRKIRADRRLRADRRDRVGTA